MRSLPVLQPLCVLPVIRKHSISVGEDRCGARERNARRKFRAAVLPHYYYLLLLLLLQLLLPLLLYGEEEGVGWKTGQAGAASCAGRGRRGESETL